MSNPNDPTHPSPFDTGEIGPRHVGLFCDDFADDCENEISGDFLVRTRDEAFAALRRHAAEQGWQISPKADYCPEHAR